MFDSGLLGKLGMLKRGLGVVSRGNQGELVGRKSGGGAVRGGLPCVGTGSVEEGVGGGLEG